ncbi:MAG TPA: hypothetical protein VHJ34_00110 [Actinomycetota bacterium]|nr:hypothetical protein [Actinomycetota bacterium]
MPDEQPQPTAYERFESLFRRLLAVDKQELDEPSDDDPYEGNDGNA